MTLFSAMQRLLRLGRPHWRVLALAFVCMTLVALSTGAWAFLSGPLLTFLLTGGRDGAGRVLALLPWLEAEGARALYVLPAVLLAVSAVKGAGYLGQFYFAGLFGQHVVVSLRRAVFEKFLKLSVSARSTSLSGDLLARFTTDVAAVEQAATYTVASWLRDSLQILVLTAVAIAVSWKLALLSLVVVPLAVWPVSRLSAALLRRFREGQAAGGLIAAQVQEGLGALRTIQAFNAEEAEAQRFAKQTARLEVSLARAASTRAAVPALMELLAACAIGGSIAWALTTRAVAAPELVSFVVALGLLYEPAKDLGRVSQFALSAGAALERIEALLALPEVHHAGTKELLPLSREIVCDGVHFSWGDGRAPVFSGLSLTLRAGEVTAISAPSGGGKSTLLALLLGFEQPSQGSITFDGIDAREATWSSLRAQFAYVSQEPLLFSAPVRDNLLVAKADATEAQLHDALRVAHALDFVLALPQGLDTPVGERGVTLSGGQKQRLCLARAVLSGAPVLVLDEATSNLDPQSEHEVLTALDDVLKGRTAILIAHRASALRAATRVITL